MKTIENGIRGYSSDFDRPKTYYEADIDWREAAHPKNAGHYKQGTKRGLIGAGAITKVSWGECKPKDLIGIPWMLAFALRADGWYLRQEIIWHKPNPMPESVVDRCTKSHESIFLLSKSRNYHFDAAAIAEPCSSIIPSHYFQNTESPTLCLLPEYTSDNLKAPRSRYGGNKYTQNPEKFYRTKSGSAYDYKSHRNKRSVWTVCPQPFNEAHFATYPPELIQPCVLAGSRPGGIVLDPFFGSGTTGLVAREHGREFIGIEINPEYVKIAKKRLSCAQLKAVVV
ncbi:MAG: site-specific DNA-methyltransferase [Chitinispirillia bacterium]|nr:site-specific DNA-methyltransferase [Chitinispirillia bacterium]